MLVRAVFARIPTAITPFEVKNFRHYIITLLIFIKVFVFHIIEKYVIGALLIN